MTEKLKNATGLYMEGIRDGYPREAIAKYTGDRYTQHSTGVKDGPEGFIEFFEEFLPRNPVRDIQIVRSIVDGQYVFVHVYQSLNNGESRWVTGDFFDTDEDDKVIEHWDVIAEYTDQSPSGHTAVDGRVQITDLDKTEENKTVVRSMITDVLTGGGDSHKIDDYISAETYVRHNEASPDGLEHFKRVALAEKRPLVYDEIVLLVGEGNFVATQCKARVGGVPYAQVDIFRIEGGLVVEHWDIAEPVPPMAEWTNSGKF